MVCRSEAIEMELYIDLMDSPETRHDRKRMHRNEANSLVLIDENLITTPVGLQQGTADHFEKTHHEAAQLQQGAAAKSLQ